MDKTKTNSSWGKLTALLEMIKFSHTVFAFPFALMGVVLASLASGTAPTFGQLFWICIAMIGARTGAMGLNRIIDARIDADNPRTSERHLPAEKLPWERHGRWLQQHLLCCYWQPGCLTRSV